MLAWAAEAAERLRTLEDSDDRILVLTSRLEQLDAELGALADRISAARRRLPTVSAPRFSTSWRHSPCRTQRCDSR